MALTKHLIIAKAQHIYENRPVPMDKQTLHTST